jgi:phosphoribosylformylglycinamidine synthase
MKCGVISFPGSLDDADTLYSVSQVLGFEGVSLWHKDRDLHGVDCIVLPGGFSYGDYLRSGALARFAPVMDSVVEFAANGGLVMGLCNGFQILCEAGLLPGALVRNQNLLYVCDEVRVRVERSNTPFTNTCATDDVLRLPIKHGEGCYVADEATLRRIEEQGQVLVRYVDESGEPTAAANPNGSLHNIAGIVNETGNVFGMMPHAEHACERLLGLEDGARIFRSIDQWLSRGGRA